MASDQGRVAAGNLVYISAAYGGEMGNKLNMAKTKQTAGKSTGGRIPRRELAQKAAQKTKAGKRRGGA